VSTAKSWATETSFLYPNYSVTKIRLYYPVLMEMNTRHLNMEERLDKGIKTNCKFLLYARKQSDRSWNLNLTNLTNNHACPSSSSGISNAQRDSNQQHEQILCLTAENVRPNQILQLLDENNLVNKRTPTIWWL